MAVNLFAESSVNSADSEQIKIATNKVFGFWIYLMSDCVLFATLFATFAMLNFNHGNHIFDLPMVLIETFCLLTSSFTFGLAMHSMSQEKKIHLIIWLAVTFILGLTFIFLEIHDFFQLIATGKGPNQNAFWSAFFTLVGTHGLHVFFGLLWMAVMIVKIFKKGLSLTNQTRLILLSLFWHFLDIIWICIFTFVYLLGSV